MTRSILDAQFQELRMGIVQMGTLVETALSRALQALQSGDQALSSLVIESDRAIDDLRLGVEWLALQLLTLQRNVMRRRRTTPDEVYLSEYLCWGNRICDFFHQFPQWQGTWNEWEIMQQASRSCCCA